MFLRTEDIKARNGGWDEDVEVGSIRATNTIQAETHRLTSRCVISASWILTSKRPAHCILSLD